jgi:hypothetical protein
VWNAGKEPAGGSPLKTEITLGWHIQAPAGHWCTDMARSFEAHPGIKSFPRTDTNKIWRGSRPTPPDVFSSSRARY